MVEIRTIVPLDARFTTYDKMIPNTTEKIAILHEIRMVCLKPLPSTMAVKLGITINEEISKTPTNLIDAMTVIRIDIQTTNSSLILIKGSVK
jgi:hypothetical protein